MFARRLVVLLSWVLTTSIVGAAIFSTPYMRAVLRGEAVESASSSIGALIFFSVVCGWPWLLAYKLPQSPSGNVRRYVFALTSVGIAAAFFNPISKGIDFETGLYTIFFVIAIWLWYPLLSVLVVKWPTGQS